MHKENWKDGVLTDAGSSIDLDRSVTDCDSHLRHNNLDHSNIFPRLLRAPFVYRIGTLKSQQSRLLNLHP